MKRLAFLASVSSLLFTFPVSAAAITSRMTDSVQLTVDGAASQATRIGHSYSASGNGVTTTDGTTSGVVGNAVLMTSDGFTAASAVITASQETSGEEFTFSASYLQGDAVPTGTTVTSGVVGSLPAFGSVTTSSGGVAGSLAGTLSATGVPTVTAGGAGTTGIAQRSYELSVFK